MWQINQKNCKYMAIGSSFGGTGGGYTYHNNLKLYSELCQKGSLSVIKFDELPESSWVFSGYTLGASQNKSKSMIPFGRLVNKLQEVTGHIFSAVIPGEIGSEVSAFYMAEYLGLPVLDTDLVGGRATPTVDKDIFGLFNLDIYPVVIGTEGDQIEVIIHDTAKDIEIIARKQSVNQTNGVYIVGYSLSIKKAKKYLPVGTLSSTLVVGEKLIKYKDNQDKLYEFLNDKYKGCIKRKGMVTDINPFPLPGFSAKQIKVNNESQTIKIYAVNEYIAVDINGDVWATSPDLIVVIDEKTGLPVHNSQLYQGQQVIIYAMKAHSVWQTKKGIDLFSPLSFGIHCKHVRIGGL